MRINKYILEIILISICFLTLLPTAVIAVVDEYTLLEPLPGMGGANPAPGLVPYLVQMFKIGIGVAGVLAVIMIVIGGLQYMTTEAIGGKSEAKSRINNAIFGLVLALSSYLLLNTINTDLTNSTLTLEPVPASPTVPPTPDEKQYSGTCKTSSTGPLKLCWGKSQSACQTHCNTTCSTTVTITTECHQTATDDGGVVFKGGCKIGTTYKSYENLTMPGCLEDQANTCIAPTPVQVIPCQLQTEDD